MRQSRIATTDDLEPHGITCPYCSRPPFQVGEEMVEVLEGMIGDTPEVLIVCPACADKFDTLVECEPCNGTGGIGIDPGEQCQRCRGSGRHFPAVTS